MKKGSEILPEENYRLKQEDIYAVQVNKEPRDGSFGSTQATSVYSEFPGETPEFREPSKTLYARAGDNKVTL